MLASDSSNAVVSNVLCRLLSFCWLNSQPSLFLIRSMGECDYDSVGTEQINQRFLIFVHLDTSSRPKNDRLYGNIGFFVFASAILF